MCLSFQEEADTRIILHCLHIATQSSDDSSIIVRSPDTDVFMLLLRFASQVTMPLCMDTGTGDKRRLINVKSIAQELGPSWCSALLGLHAYTGCDSTSAFVRKGKLAPLRTLRKYEQFLPTLASLGTNSEVTQDQFHELEAFTCLLYGSKAVLADINRLRFVMFTTRYTPNRQLLSAESGVDLSLLPPCQSSLQMHIKRVNFQCMVWLHADIARPDLPKPDEGHGWVTDRDGQLDYQWTEGDILPIELADLLVEATSSTQNANDDEDNYVYNMQEDVLEDAEATETDDTE